MISFLNAIKDPYRCRHASRIVQRRAVGFEPLEHRRLLAALRVAAYNVLQGSPSNSTEDAYYTTILDAIGNEQKAGVQQAVDLLVLQETNGNSINRLESILDGLYTDDYATHLSPSYGGLHYGFVYNTASLQILSTKNVTGPLRPPLRGHFQPIGATESDTDFYVYSVHLRADSGSCNPNCDVLRATEASQIRANADALGEGENVLIVGDFNMKGSFEGAYTNLTASGAGQVQDPINRPGNWNNNSQFIDIHTQDPDGPGGMDDRFDIQFASGELFVSGGLDYIAGSYRAFGNNGSHSLNGNLTGTGAAANVLDALRNASDHLPVVADYFFQTSPPGVTIDQTEGNTIVAENGYLDDYTVVLDALPDADVTVTISPDSQVDIGAGPGVAVPLVFTPQNYDIPQTVTVIAVDDLVAEGNHVSTLVHSIASADPDYNSLLDVNVDVVVVDDETPTILINEVDSDTVGNLQFVELYDGGIGGSSLTGKTVVFFDGTSDTSYAAFDLDGFSTDANGLFVLGNSGVPGAGLSFADGLLQRGADAVALYNDDPASFPNGTPVTAAHLVDALVYDTDDADDAGLLATLMLTAEPQVNENGNGSQSSESLSRLPDGGQARQSSTVEATTPTPGALNSPRAPGFVIMDQETVAVAEGGSGDSYTIALTSVPSANVNVTLDPDVELDLGAGPGLPVVLTFSPLGAMSPQTVAVNAVDDSFAEGAHNGIITHSISSGDSGYAALSINDVTAEVTDNEPPPPPSVVISEIMYNPATAEGAFSPEWVEIVNVGGAPADISGWKLDDEDATDWGSIPPATVLQPGQVAVLFDGTTTPFTTEAGFRSTWSVPVAALVIGVDWPDLDNEPSATNEILELRDDQGFPRDTVNFDDQSPWPVDSPEGPSIYLTDLTADGSSGANWARSTVGTDDAVAANGFPFSSSDVGSPGNVPPLPSGTLIINESNSSTEVVEAGAGDDFSIVLDANPTDSVQVTLTPDAQLDLGAGAGVAIVETFTPTTGLIPIQIDVAAFDDQTDESPHPIAAISFTLSSNDLAYDGLTVADLSVDVTDNDTAGVTIVESGGSTDVTEGGSTDDFTVVLDTIPSADVTVTITPDAELDLGSGQGVAIDRVFNSGNALIPQVVTVAAFDDSDDEGIHSGVVSFAVASTDSKYNGQSIADLTANITDNDADTLLNLTAESETYTGPGTYTLDFYATATGGSQTIVGFNLPINVSVPGVTFNGTASDFSPNAAFPLEFVAPLSQPGNWGLAGTTTTTGLTIADGASEILFSIDLVVDGSAVITSPTEVATIVTSGPDAINLQFFDENNQSISNINVGTGAILAPVDPPPTITDVIVSGTAWTGSFVSGVGTNGVGFSLPGADQELALPWNNLTTITVEFSEHVQKADGSSVDLADISLTGINTADYELAGAGLSAAYSDGGGAGPYRLTLSLASAATFAADRLALSIADTVQDGTGNALDGEWTDSVSVQSGNGTAGGNALIRFNVLPGDADRSGAVFSNDVFLINSLQFTLISGPPYDIFKDIDGSGSIFANDVFVANISQFTFLPPGTPPHPPPAQDSGLHSPAMAVPAFSSKRETDDRWSAAVDDVFDDWSARFFFRERGLAQKMKI